MSSTNIMTEKEWNKFQDSINVEFVNENLFIEKMKIQLLQSKIESWESVKTVGGTVFSFRELMKRIFGLTDNEIDEQLQSIENEKHQHKFDIFYKLADLEISNEYGLMGQIDGEGNPLDADDVATGIFADGEDSEELDQDYEEPEEDFEDEEEPEQDFENEEPDEDEEKNDIINKFLRF